MARKINLPRAYLPPSGGPLFWKNEGSGALQVAVLAYLRKVATADELELLAAYLEYYIDAPCWELAGFHAADGWRDKLEELRADARKMESWNEINNWIMKALDYGIDPL